MSELFRVPLYDNDGDKVPDCTPTVYYSHPSATDMSANNFTICSANSGVATERTLPDGSGSGQYYIVLTDAEWNDGVVDILAVPTAEDKSVRNAKDTPTYYDDTKINQIQTNITTILDLVEAGTVANITGTGGDGLSLIHMLDLLRVMLNEINPADDEPFEFRLVMALEALNIEQKPLVRDLPPSQIYMLEATPETLTPDSTDGYIDILTDLAQTILDGRDGLIKLIHSGYSKPCKIMSQDEWRFEEHIHGSDLDNLYSIYNPVAYWYNSRLYIKPFTGYTVQAYYLREPVTMVLNARGNENDEVHLIADGNIPLLMEPRVDTAPDNVNCELPLSAQYALVERAAARLFRQGRDPVRGQVHANVAAEILRQLWDKHKPSDSARFGAPYNNSLDPYGQRGSYFNFYTGSSGLL